MTFRKDRADRLRINEPLRLQASLANAATTQNLHDFLFSNFRGFSSHILLFLYFFVGFYPHTLEISFFYGITGRS